MIPVVSNTLREMIIHRTKPAVLLVICLAAIFIYLLDRVWGNIASVFPDEYIHAKFARYTDLADVEIPSYLYYAVYRLTLYFDDRFLDAARVLNATFFLAGCYFVYAVARRFTSERLAMMVAIFTALSPLNTYVNYFMAESMFFFFFWMFIAVATSERLRFNYRGNVFIGIIFGCLLLVKPHAIILLPIYPLAALVANGARLNNVKLSLVFIVAALTVKFAVGYLVAGTQGLAIFGSLYARHAADALGNSIDVAYAVRSVWINLLGNTFSLVSVLGLALVYLFVVTPIEGIVDSGNNSTQFLKWLIGWALFIFVPFVSVFATTVALFDDNINYRIYMRYYNYAFPLIHIYALTFWNNQLSHVTKAEKAGLVSLFGGVLIYVVYHHATTLRMLPYKVLGTDTPDFFLLQYSALWFYTAILASISILTLWVYRPTLAIRGFFVVFVPAYLLITNVNNIGSIDGRSIATTADEAGKVASSIIPNAEHGAVLAIGNHDLELARFLIYLKSGDSQYEEITTNEDIIVSNLDSSMRWLVVFGDSQVKGPAQKVHESTNYSIYKRE